MTAAEQGSDSLLSALAKARVPTENHEFIVKMTSAAGIDRYQAMSLDSSKPYVLATRRNGMPALHIYYGYTNGFTSEEEIVEILGSEVTREPSSRSGTWYVAHPVNEIRPRRERSRDVSRENSQFCKCGIQLSLTGACDYCD
ncbi:hypothetical protein [Mycobacterium sp. shizuoka-1]|uniref:hypothetical protein n=1 Tax=Mycobacterium sp. shizuoka-1 TaxID=2039281 RepID=UPI000C05FA2E|nr:hypothetical protein [Mycobacterium sp. shizuoka-1]GAY16440.1 hypothetical protein MSZK_31660 [Mycobacterium sp. shizuoka-1]